MKILIALLVLFVSPWALAEEKIYSDAVKKIMDEGQSGKFTLEGTCPDTLSKEKDKIESEDVVQYVQFCHKKILGSTPLNNPAEAAKNLGSVLDAAAALACQLEGKQGKAIDKKEPDRWISVFKGEGYKKYEAIGDTLVDRGFFLQKDGQHKAAIAEFKAAAKMSPRNELAFLYMGDSQWVLKQKAEAKQSYLKYVDIRHAKFGPHGTMAPQVEERLNEGKPPKKSK